MSIYGYARVSSLEQNLARQIEALTEEKVDRIFMDKVSGATMERPQLQEMFSLLKEGDTIIVTDITRISRSSMDLFNMVEDLQKQNIGIKSLKDTWLDISDSNPYSKFLLTVMAGVSQLERDLMKMRQKEGIAIAKKRGAYKGRPKKYTEKNPRMAHALNLYKEGAHSVRQVCEAVGISESTFYREWRNHKQKEMDKEGSISD